MTTIGSVEDYSSLRKLKPGEYDFVLIRRGTSNEPQLPISTPPDGGIFVWDNISNDNDDWGTIIAPNPDGANGIGRWKRLYSGRLNVKWFNAKGDGVTDDLPALKDAADAAKQLNADLEIPAGNYFVSGRWILSGSTCSIMGTGLVTLQCLNPQELANLDGPAEKGADQFKVSSTDNFSKNQQIKFIKIDDQNHLAYDVYTVDSIDGSQHSIHLKEKLKQTYDTADPNNRNRWFLVTALDDAVIEFNENVINASIENIHVEGIGPLVLGVQRSGISFKGKESLRCVNVESYNHSQNGIFIYHWKTNNKANIKGERHLSFNGCNFHDNGYSGIYGAPIIEITEPGKPTEIQTGSVEIIGGIYSHNGPEWSGSSAYGVTLNGSKTIIIGSRCENNTGPQIDSHSQSKSTLIVQGCTLAWGKSNGLITPNVKTPGGMVDVSGQVVTLIVEGCDMDGSGANFQQMYGVSAGGNQIFRILDKNSLEVGCNQETIKVVNNNFRNMDCVDAAVYLSPWDAKVIEIVGNTFINCVISSILIDNQAIGGCFDPLTLINPSSNEVPKNLVGFDKRKIPDIIRIEGNTFVDSGRCYVTCGGLVMYVDNFFIRKYSDPYTIAPFVVGTGIGRVGKALRRNNKAIGLSQGVLTYTPTTATLPTHFHWDVGDQEINEAPLPGSFLGYVCTVAGTADTKTTTGTKATTTPKSTIIDVSDCTPFCQYQWITVAGETFSK